MEKVAFLLHINKICVPLRLISVFADFLYNHAKTIELYTNH